MTADNLDVDWVVTHALRPDCSSSLTYCGLGLPGRFGEQVIRGGIEDVSCGDCIRDGGLLSSWRGRVAPARLPIPFEEVLGRGGSAKSAGGRRSPLKPLSGDECLHGTGRAESPSVIEFWRWAFSDLATNTIRAVFAEFIVGSALDALGQARDPWTEYDLHTPEGVRVEVKSSAYVQSWDQAEPSRISFSIAKARRWGYRPTRLVGELKRHSDVYVFCVLAHRECETLDPSDLDQWQFYVLPTAVLDRKVGDQKTIGLPALGRLGALAVAYPQLRAAVLEAAAERIGAS